MCNIDLEHPVEAIQGLRAVVVVVASSRREKVIRRVVIEKFMAF